MPDNVTLNAMSGGAIVAADDINGVMVQRVKIGHGGDGVYADTAFGNPLPVGVAAGTSAGAQPITGTTAGPVQLPAITGAIGATIKAGRGNTGTIYIGGATVTPADGFDLAPGETLSVDLSDLSALSMAVDTDGDTARVLWVIA